MKEWIEREGKYRIPDEAGARSLLGTSRIAGFSLGEAHVVHIQDTYFDTAEGALRAEGWALRWRQGEEETLVTLKALDGGTGGIKERREVEDVVPKDLLPPEIPPCPLADRVRELTKDLPLSRVAELEQIRVIRPVLAHGAIVAELSVDDVRFGESETSWEAEIEARDSEALPVLEAIGQALAKEWGCTPEPRSKYERALEKTAERGAPDRAEEDEEAAEGSVEADPSIGSFAVAAVRKNLGFLRSNLAPAATGKDPELVHHVRVAARRLRTCVALFDEEWDPKLEQKTDKHLKLLCKSLGEVRDLDVILNDARAYKERLSPPRAEGFNAFILDLERRREDALDRLRSDVGEANALKLFGALRSLVKAAPAPKKNVQFNRPARIAAPVILTKSYANLLAFDFVCHDADIDETLYHETRRAAKGFRYALEFLEAALGPGSVRCAAEVKAVQDHLGKLNDAVSASHAAAAFLTGQAVPLSGNLRSHDNASVVEVARYLAKRQADSRRLVSAFPSIWKRVASPAFRKRLFKALGE